MPSWPDWAALRSAVQRADYHGEEFKVIKDKVLSASPAELSEVTPENKKLVWEFLVGVGEKRSPYRNQIIQVIKSLARDPQCVGAWQASPELHERAQALHSDLAEVLLSLMIAASEALPDEPLDPVQQAPWPEWGAIKKAVDEARISRASEEFNEIQSKILKASPEELDGQSASAEIMWTFLVEFAGGRSIYRSRVLQMINKLMEAPSWMAAFMLMDDLKAKARSLPEQLQEALNLGAAESSAKGPIKRSQTFEERLQAAMEPVSDGTFTNAVTAPTNAVAGSSSESEKLGFSRLPQQDTPVAPASAFVTQDVAPATVASSKSIGESTPKAEGDGDDIVRRTSSKPDIDDKALLLSTLVPTVETHIKQADMFDATMPVAAYFCRRYALELLIPARQKGISSPESDAILFGTLTRVEKDQSSLPGNEQERKDLMEGFALFAFDQACNLERASSVAGIAVPYFYLSGLLLDSLVQFYDGKLPAHLQEKAVTAHLRGTAHTGGAVSIASLPPYPPGSQPAVTAAASLMPGGDLAAAPMPGGSLPPAAAPTPTVAPAASPYAAPAAPSAGYPVTPCDAPPAVAPAPAPAAAPAAAAPAAAPRARTSAKNMMAAQKLLPKAEAKVDFDDLVGARKMILEALALLES